MQRLCLVREAIGHVTIELIELIRQRPYTFLQALVLLPQYALDFFIGVGALVFFVAQLSG